jgi:hypothetical protein
MLLAALFRGVEIFRETVEVHFARSFEGGLFFVFVELF